ncbi:MAG TPA: hypothetical protein VN843_21355, partial [Anaerolineales bacterium]|nr:hypothetical protein [Anaerolineales bacterium]
TTNIATASGTALGTTVTATASATVTVGTTPCPLTPGYWKNHMANSNSSGPFSDPDCRRLPSGNGCSSNGPWVKQFLPQSLGNYQVTGIILAAKVFNSMNCSSSKPNDAIGCLAGHLLAAKLNVANGAGNACIAAVITKANNFLKSMVVDGVTGINYVGPTGNYTLSAAQRTLTISLKDALDKYNNNLGCP